MRDTMSSLNEDERVGGSTSGRGVCDGTAIEKESFAIVPSHSLFRDVVKTVLTKLGYTAPDINNSKGAVQIKNWRALDLDQVTDNALVSVKDMLGDLTTVATLRIKITSSTRSDDVKDKLLMLLVGQSYDTLQSRGCPVSKDDLERVVSRGGEFTSATRTSFFNWFNKLSTSGVQCPPSSIDQCNQLPSSGGKTRLRMSFDTEEVNKLQKWFEQDAYPSRVVMTSYLNELNSQPVRTAANKPLDLTNIMYWFKNARAAARRNGQSITSDDLSEDEDRQSEREELSTSAPSLPNSNAVYMINNPLLANNNKDDNLNKESATSGDANGESEMDEDLSVTDDDDAEEKADSQQNEYERESSETHTKKEVSSNTSSSNQTTTKANNVSSAASPNLSVSLINSMASRLPSYPFPYGPLPMAYLQSQMNPFYKDWTEKVQSAVAQVQANSAQQNMKMVKADCELSKAERQKRHRAFIDPVSEIPKLEQWFNKDTHPSHYVIEQICDDLNRGEFRSRYPKLSPKNIQLWFKNHRAKVKRSRVGGGSLSLSFNDVGSPSMSPPPSGLSISTMLS